MVTSNAPFTPLPVFSNVIAKETISPASMPERLASIGSVSRSDEVIVSVKRGPDVPGAENTAGPTEPVRTASTRSVAITPFVISSSGLVKVKLTIAFVGAVVDPELASEAEA